MPPKTRSLPLTSPVRGDKPLGSSAEKGTFAFVSLGCPKNLVDSERMLGKLAQDGYALQPDADGADVVVVNTCGFIEPARQESLGRHPRDARAQEAGQGRGRRRRRLPGRAASATCCSKQVPGVDQIVGVFGREEIAAVVDRAVAAARRAASRCSARPRCGPSKTPPGCASRRGTTPT